MNHAPKILLVDDEEDLLNDLSTFLEEEGYTVLTALDGETALKKIEEEKPDLILLDLNIPKLSGFQILERVRRQPVLDKSYVIGYASYYGGETDDHLKRQPGPREALQAP